MLRMSGLSVRVLKEMMYQEIIFIALSLLAAHGQEGTKKKKKKKKSFSLGRDKYRFETKRFI